MLYEVFDSLKEAHGENIVRNALDRFEFCKFETLKKYFPYVKSVKEFISSLNYLGSIGIEVLGPKDKISKLTPTQKLEMALFVVKKISEQVRTLVPVEGSIFPNTLIL